MAALPVYHRLVKRPHGFYRSLWDSDDPEVQQLFAELAQITLPFGRLTQISNETGIPYKTLQDWRSNLLKDPSYTPGYPRKGISARVEREIEEEVANFLRREYIERNRYCPMALVKGRIEMLARERTGEDFTAGRTYLKGFLKRHGLSLRVPHVRRRTAPNDEKVAEFLLDVDAVREQFPENLIYNVDETCWRLINGSLKTLAATGQEEVAVDSACNPKTDITVIAAVTKAGDRLPLYLLAKGKTPRCMDKYRNSPLLRRHFASHSLAIDYSRTGWSDRGVMTRYLAWLRHLAGDRLINVMWDVHASHRHADVRDWASEHDVGLTFIPAGQTGTWQPLDRRIFGSLKARATRILNESVIEESFEDHDMIRAISVLVRAWEEIGREEIQHAWSHFD